MGDMTTGRFVVKRNYEVHTLTGRTVGHMFHVYPQTWEATCSVDGCGWSRDERYMRDGVSELHMHHLSKHNLDLRRTGCEPGCRHRCPECRMGLGSHLRCDPQCMVAAREVPTAP